MIDPKNYMYTEKYRPKKVSEIVGDFKEKILKYLENPQALPHFLLYSKVPGTGKTSTAKAIINELGCDALILNSSDDRKIEAIRDKVKEFSMTQSTKSGQRRCVFLDEFDGMLKASQEALRNVMETYANNVFFILTCVEKGTKIYTPDGFKKVENIKNEIINTHKIPIENKKTIERKKSKILDIKTKHGFDIKVTPEHKFLINGKWILANKLLKNDNIDIDLNSLYGNNIELENNKYNIFNKEFKECFISFLKEKNIPSDEVIKQISSYRTSSLLPQEIDLYKKLSYKKQYTVYDIMNLDNNKLKKHRYNNMIANIKKIGGIERIGNIYTKKKIKAKNYNFYNLVKIINTKYGYNFNVKELYTIYRCKTNIITIDKIISLLKPILNISSTDYKKIAAIGRLSGFIYGDGYLNESIHFAGNIDCLEKVKKDINLFYPITLEIIKNGYPEGNGYCFRMSKKELSLFFEFIGCPKGKKVGQPMKIPTVCYSNKLLMKSFIQALFDCEVLNLTMNKNNKTFNEIRFMQRSTIGLCNKKDKFFNELQYVLKTFFSIESYIRYYKSKEHGTFKPKIHNQPRIEKFLYIKKESSKLKFLSTIGNYYEDYKKHIDFFGYMLYKKYNQSFGYKFITFDEWKLKYFDKNILRDEIISIEKYDGEFEVYDLALDSIHSYISNGFISHNCNNINKVIPPLQSRCVKIPFAHPRKEEIAEYLKMICSNETMNYTEDGLSLLIEINYPSIRNCVLTLQDLKTEGLDVTIDTVKPVNNMYEDLWQKLLEKDWKYIKKIVMKSTIDPRDLNSYFWEKSLYSDPPKLRMLQICCKNEKDISSGADAKIILVTSLIEMVK